MRATDIILKKRSGEALTQKEIHYIIEGYVNKSIPEYQVSALLMAIFFQGMTPGETAFLTREMIDSGEIIQFKGDTGRLVDKHSTGGVGDKLSLILAPLAASAGVKIPMMSGRALGHTGGTLDKLDSIPGYRTALPVKKFKKIIDKTGFAMTGQSEEIVPADRLMYSLRDVTGTVESIPLITASILSKKFAEGASSLVFDVKYGSGAFMKTPEEADKLAFSLVNSAKSLGRRAVALLTNMEQPLGYMVGNFLEVEEAIACLEGKGPEDVMEVTLGLAAHMMLLAKVAMTEGEAYSIMKEKLANGEALKCFLKNVEAQGGDTEELMKMRGKARSRCHRDILAPKSGYITHFDAYAVGHAGVIIKVGRNKTTDPVEALAGFELFRKKGDKVTKGEPLCRIWAEDESLLAEAVPLTQSAYEISDEPVPQASSLIKKVVS